MEEKERLAFLKKEGRSFAEMMLKTAELSWREVYVEGISEIMCLRCCQPRAKNGAICHCENDE